MILTIGWMTAASLVALIGIARAWPVAAERAAGSAA
jgi:hypothetical protein